MFWGPKGWPDLHLGGGGGVGARGRHRNVGCTIKSQMGGGGEGGTYNYATAQTNIIILMF